MDYRTAIMLTWPVVLIGQSCGPALRPIATIDTKNQDGPARSRVLDEFDSMLRSYVDGDGFFDRVGALDVAILKRTAGTLNPVHVYSASLGRAHAQQVLDGIPELEEGSVLQSLQQLAKRAHPGIPDVDARAGERTRYRIASNTKTFVGLAATRFESMYAAFDLDMRVSPRFIDLRSLGRKHGWDAPTAERGYPQGFASATVYSDSITFRHLLDHRSGLSRESKRGGQYGYGSSRTHSALCPGVETSADGAARCVQREETRPWRAWVEHLIPYMMPACGYEHYPEASARRSCLPGEYYHYSNVGYAILGKALDSFLKQEVDAELSLEGWIRKHIFVENGMSDTVFTWRDYGPAGRLAAAHGCHGGERRENCDFGRALTDFADRGVKTMPGGIWSSAHDLAKYLLRSGSDLILSEGAISGEDLPERDSQSEEESHHMPARLFHYGRGWYVAPEYNCTEDDTHDMVLQGAWGTVPGYTSYMITNARPRPGEDQYAVVMLRSYNYADRLNLGNQSRRLLWRLIYPERPQSELLCPVLRKDSNAVGDQLF